MTTGEIPHSGDYLRIFSRTDMTAGALRLANAIAGHISFDGSYRGAPVGAAAFTMTELAAITGLCSRTIRRALAELAEIFGLSVERRHHDRHLFRFTGIHDEPAQREEHAPETSKPMRQTGHQSPASLYIYNKENNDPSLMIDIGTAPTSVHQSEHLDLIRETKKGTASEQTDTNFLWRGFLRLNQRNGNRLVPRSWLVAFIRKAQPAFSKPSEPQTHLVEKPVVRVDPLVRMAQKAPSVNRHFHEAALVRAIGRDAYEQRVESLMKRYNRPRFAAQLATHGNAVKEGLIQP